MDEEKIGLYKAHQQKDKTVENLKNKIKETKISNFQLFTFPSAVALGFVLLFVLLYIKVDRIEIVPGVFCVYDCTNR